VTVILLFFWTEEKKNNKHFGQLFVIKAEYGRRFEIKP